MPRTKEVKNQVKTAHITEGSSALALVQDMSNHIVDEATAEAVAMTVNVFEKQVLDKQKVGTTIHFDIIPMIHGQSP
ncbi:MAG: hypothetical protein FWF81_03160 [Defluviitaleaceae bacterium]|nr:hypothetical protein [Defluviitaleaceae bacterium]